MHVLKQKYGFIINVLIYWFQELNTHKVIQNNAKITSLITPDIKVLKNWRLIFVLDYI